MMEKEQTPNEFKRLFKDFLLRFENQKLKLESNKDPVLEPLDTTLANTLMNIFRIFSKADPGNPEDILKSAIKSLPELEAQRLLIDNLLESSKRGQDFKETVESYYNLGLMTSKFNSNQQPEKENLGAKLIKRKNIWQRITLFVGQVALNALKSIPEWVEIEPMVTLVPVPSIGFSFKGKGMSLQDLFDTLFQDTELKPDELW